MKKTQKQEYEEYKKLYRDSITIEDANMAYDSQSACNATALVHDLSRRLSSLRERTPKADTDWINQHPIITLYVASLVHLNHRGLIGRTAKGLKAYDMAYDLICDIINQH